MCILQIMQNYKVLDCGPLTVIDHISDNIY